MFHFRSRQRGLIATLAPAALAAVLGFAMPGFAAAEGRGETLVIVTEEGPSTLDIDAATANVQTHEVSWNIYDRLITHARNQLPDGTWTYDYTKFEPELAESWELAPDGKSVTFKLRPDAIFHDGTPVTAKDVKWSFDRAVAVGGFPAIQMGASRNEVARPVRRGRRPHLPGRLPPPEQADPAQPRGADRQGDQLGARQEERHRRGPLGARLGRQERRRQRRLHGRELEARHRRSSSSASTTGSRAPCPTSRGSSAARSPRSAPAGRSSRRATPTSPSTCRRRTSPSWPRRASSPSSARRSTPSSSTST